MSSSTIIMLTGSIGVGKSQVASFLRTEGFKEYAFASPLKQIAKALGFSDKEVNGTQEEKLVVNPFWGVSGREFLQTFGSEVCRDFLPTVLPAMFPGKPPQTLWCRLAQKFVQDTVAADKQASIVFSDGRFPDEADFVRSVGGVVVRIERPSLTAASTTEHKVASHQSEQGTSSIHPDYVIINDGTLRQLEEAINTVVHLFRTSARTSSPALGHFTVKASHCHVGSTFWPHDE